jgi:hypothetical protein
MIEQDGSSKGDQGGDLLPRTGLATFFLRLGLTRTLIIAASCATLVAVSIVVFMQFLGDNFEGKLIELPHSGSQLALESPLAKRRIVFGEKSQTVRITALAPGERKINMLYFLPVNGGLETPCRFVRIGNQVHALEIGKKYKVRGASHGGRIAVDVIEALGSTECGTPVDKSNMVRGS